MGRRPDHDPEGHTAMTEFRYTDREGCELAVRPHGTPDAPSIWVEAPQFGATVPPADVPGVILGVLAQTAAAQGRVEADPFGHIRADLDATTDRPGAMYTRAEVDAAQDAQARILDKHMPLLLALATAYVNGDPRGLYDLIRRAQAETLDALNRASRAHARAAAMERERDSARAELADTGRAVDDAHPPVNEFRVEQHEPGCEDCPSGQWHVDGPARRSADEGAAAMRSRREHRPHVGPMRVVRERTTFTVVTTEDTTK